jgi:hypothetical protein
MHKKKRIAMIKQRKRQTKLKLRRKMLPAVQSAPARAETPAPATSAAAPRVQVGRKAPARTRPATAQRAPRTEPAAAQERPSGTRRRQTRPRPEQSPTEGAEETPK